MDSIRTILIDDHQCVLKGLQLALKRFKNVEVVAIAKDAPSAIAIVGSHLPDVVILDICIPEKKDGIKAMSQIQSVSPSSKILVFSGYSDDRQFVQDIFDAGASGFLDKACDLPDLENAINDVYQGKCYLCPKTAKLMMMSKNVTVESQKASSLTPRETEILTMISQGKSTKEIAYNLDLSINTVYVHQRHLKKVLKLSTTAELVMFAMKIWSFLLRPSGPFTGPDWANRQKAKKLQILPSIKHG